MAKNILKRSKTNKPFVVISRNGTPSAIWDLDKYRQQQERAKTVQPWTHRKRKATVDPMGAIAGHVRESLARSSIYDERRPPPKRGFLKGFRAKRKKKSRG